jgi:hypothetical protein
MTVSRSERRRSWSILKQPGPSASGSTLRPLLHRFAYTGGCRRREGRTPRELRERAGYVNVLTESVEVNFGGSSKLRTE